MTRRQLASAPERPVALGRFPFIKWEGDPCDDFGRQLFLACGTCWVHRSPLLAESSGRSGVFGLPGNSGVMGPPEGSGLTACTSVSILAFAFLFVFLEVYPGGAGGKGEKRETGLGLWGVRAPLGCRAVVSMEGVLAVCLWSGLLRPQLPLARVWSLPTGRGRSPFSGPVPPPS